MYLLDTNILSDLIKDYDGRVGRRASANAPELVVTSIVVAGELRYGVECRGSAALRELVEGALQRIDVLPLDGDVDHHYGRVRADVERRGAPIGANDMLIAAHALSLDATLVTADEREFRRVAGLRVENWLSD